MTVPTLSVTDAVLHTALTAVYTQRELDAAHRAALVAFATRLAPAVADPSLLGALLPEPLQLSTLTVRCQFNLSVEHDLRISAHLRLRLLPLDAGIAARNRTSVDLAGGIEMVVEQYQGANQDQRKEN